MNPVIYAADIGSIKSGNFGWARLDPEQDTTQVERNDGSEIEKLVDAVEHDLNVSARGVALGFECPLFVPVPENPFLLGAARVGEGNRPFSGRPGTGALVTGLVQIAWILRSLRERCPNLPPSLTGTSSPALAKACSFGKRLSLERQSAALMSTTPSSRRPPFRDSLPNPPAANAVEGVKPLSLIGSALLWSGWSPDPALLDKPCLVMKPSAPDASTTQ